MDGVLHDRPKGTLEMQASGASQAAPLEVWLRHFADQCSDIVTLHDAAFRTVHINDACRRLIGDRARDLPMIAVDEKMFCAAGRRVVEQGTPQRIEMRTLDGTGGERWLNMELMSVLVPGGEVPSGAGCICYMAIGRDVTQERRQRQAKRHYRQFLPEPACRRIAMRRTAHSGQNREKQQARVEQ